MYLPSECLLQIQLQGMGDTPVYLWLSLELRKLPDSNRVNKIEALAGLSEPAYIDKDCRTDRLTMLLRRNGAGWTDAGDVKWQDFDELPHPSEQGDELRTHQANLPHLSAPEHVTNSQKTDEQSPDRQTTNRRTDLDPCCKSILGRWFAKVRVNPPRH